MKENIKIGLLAVIAFTLITDTFFTSKRPSRYTTSKVSDNQSNIAASPTANTNLNTTSPITSTPPIPSLQNNPVQLSETRAKTQMRFIETSYNFGEVNQDSKNTKTFKFTNTGNEPLIIENAKGSCGCTVPTYPKEPIKPGETGEIEVVYNPGKQKGAQNKTVSITANTSPITTTLNISADVQVIP